MKPYVITELVCTECDTKMFVPRIIGKQHKEGHIKTMYCPKCKEKRQFIQIRS